MKTATGGLITFLIMFMIIELGCVSAYAETTGFISAPNRVDMVYDSARDVLYITSGSSVLRYKTATSSFLAPYTFNLGKLSGIDLSPDGNTLAIADRNITGIHLVDLQTDKSEPDITFAPYLSGEGGTFTVAYGNNGAILVTSTYNGSGWVPLRRIVPSTGEVKIIKTMVRQDTMLSGSANGKCIGFVEGNISSGPLSIYDVAMQQVTKTIDTNWFTYEIGTNRDCAQFAVPTYGGTFIYDSSLTKLGATGVYAGGQPIGVAYHPTSDIVYFAWVGTSTVRAYDSKTFALLATFDVGYTFQNPGNYAFNQGRLKVSRDGSLLFATVGNGIRYLHTALNPTADDQSLFIKSAATAITLTGSSPKQLPLSYTVVTQPAHGTLQGTAPSLTYTPDATYSGQDRFTFKTSDGALESALATITTTIDKTSPLITSFSLPGTSSTLTVAISSFSASDTVGVTGYCLSESADPAACVWSGAPPASYHFGGIGTHTLYAFARDAAGNVSDPGNATVDIPVIVPRITAFSIPATYGYNNLTIPVTYTASDDIGVTGYCLTEVPDPVACAWSSWAPTSYTFGAVGPHTLYAFARNSAGELSAPASAYTTVVGQVNFIPASSRVDTVYDSARDVVYITSGTSVLRYKLGLNTFLPAYTFGLSSLSGIDLSPDGNTLAVADRNTTGIHLIDLQTDTIKPDITFTPSFSEGGTFTVAYGNDATLLVSSTFNGSGWVPLRRVDPQTGLVTIVNSSVPANSSLGTMLSSSANGSCIGFTEGNISSGPLGIYDVAMKQITKTIDTDWYTYEVGTNRDCTQFALPTYNGTFIFDGTLTKLGTIGVYAGGQPIGVAYHPALDIVYFAWAGTRDVRAYDTKTLSQIGAFDFGYTFQNTGNSAFGQGRLKVSRDGSLLFATIQDGVRYQRLNGDAPVADDQTIIAYMGVPLPITLTGSSPKQAELTFTIITQPAHGSLQGTAPNLVYIPDATYTGLDSLTFKVSDGTLEGNKAVMTFTIKPIPTNVTLTQPTVNGRLTLSWTNPTGLGFSHIHIYRSTTAGALGALVADNLAGTTFTDTGLSSQTTYYYTVRSVDVSGNESTNTVQVSQRTLDATPPLTTATPSMGNYTSPQGITFSCNDGAGSVCAATYYCLGTGCSPATLYTGDTITIAGSTDLRYYSVDQAGNSEGVKTASYVIQPHFITVMPAPLNFGAALLYYPSNRTVTIGNTGSLPLVMGAPLTLIGQDSALFSIVTGGPNPCPSLMPTIAAGGSCTARLVFNPVTSGEKTAFLHIVSNADNNPVLDIQLTGTGIPPVYLTTKITGSGAINNVIQPPAFSCDAPSCTAPFSAGISLMLRATPSSLYNFAGWSGSVCNGTTGDCLITLTSDTTLIASFLPVPFVQVSCISSTFSSLQSAYASASDGCSFKVRNITFTDNFNLNRPINIMLKGGLESDFVTSNDSTFLKGILTVESGSLTVDNLEIQ